MGSHRIGPDATAHETRSRTPFSSATLLSACACGTLERRLQQSSVRVSSSKEGKILLTCMFQNVCSSRSVHEHDIQPCPSQAHTTTYTSPSRCSNRGDARRAGVGGGDAEACVEEAAGDGKRRAGGLQARGREKGGWRAPATFLHRRGNGRGGVGRE